jgi:hypothetical protein
MIAPPLADCACAMSPIWKAKDLTWSQASVRCASVSDSKVSDVVPSTKAATVGRLMLTILTDLAPATLPSYWRFQTDVELNLFCLLKA